MATPAVIALSACGVAADYRTSIQLAGGEPLVVAADSGPAAAVLDRARGLVLSGGADVDPARYGAARHPSCEDAEPGRDAFELDLVRTALDRDIPILAICRGVQVLNVARGGTLIQDIPTQIATRLPHDIRDPRDARAHHVRIDRDSRLAAALQPSLDPDGRIAVNSRHHQALDRVGEGLRVVATADDGIVEAVEAPGARFCVGVQWHPENFWRSGEFLPLFRAFLAAIQSG